jgi:plastocyanin
MTNRHAFSPQRVTIKAGETIEWKNTSSMTHTVTDDPSRARRAMDAQRPQGVQPFDSGRLAPGGTYTYTFKVPGIYRYFCEPHAIDGMVGQVIVTP